MKNEDTPRAERLALMEAINKRMEQATLHELRFVLSFLVG